MPVYLGNTTDGDFITYPVTLSKLLNKSPSAKVVISNAQVFADKEMISTVLRNLLSNGLKFAENAGRITISIARKNNELTVTVRDNGVGISKERISKLFSISENDTTLGTQNEKGTGLGLILCKEFVDKNNGKIWVESNEGTGSSFNFSLQTKNMNT